MPQTPNGAAAPYCSVALFLEYHDWQQIADLIRDGEGPRPTRARILDGTTPSDEYTRINRVLLAASGELEGACFVGKRYSTDDLAALTGSGAERLRKIVADLAFWTLSQRRQPGSADPDTVPGAKQALAELDRLRDGDRIFPLQESANAGLPSTSDPDPSQQANPLITNAERFFGTHRQGYNRPYRPGGY
ncbi:hypothetical protein GobsT_30990 [Gemmata obscuriglobus]|uniref:DUF1320 domain-containing protein n=1 Tax=Gemmata obscuriglobus TaxID=114 RepID=A0A2Z3HBX4_9BACT|nr:hypothetical protein [Gemmata obscuriglobus]AWM38710.1 hypothetical protein C1280_18085 [Gemmata obscuriglobus]QEG28322.1 hypothetical protein GobsT_30990 [Gemmata obscuriglobus]VTS06181.1 : DUF1320 [Gemmata obscuriglobus UQM 2246]